MVVSRYRGEALTAERGQAMMRTSCGGRANGRRDANGSTSPLTPTGRGCTATRVGSARGTTASTSRATTRTRRRRASTPRSSARSKRVAEARASQAERRSFAQIVGAALRERLDRPGRTGDCRGDDRYTRAHPGEDAQPRKTTTRAWTGQSEEARLACGERPRAGSTKMWAKRSKATANQGPRSTRRTPSITSCATRLKVRMGVDLSTTST